MAAFIVDTAMLAARAADVVAVDPMTVYLIERQRFEGLLDDVPAVAKALLRELSTRVRNLDDAYSTTYSAT